MNLQYVVVVRFANSSERNLRSAHNVIHRKSRHKSKSYDNLSGASSVDFVVGFFSPAFYPNNI